MNNPLDDTRTEKLIRALRLTEQRTDEAVALIDSWTLEAEWQTQLAKTISHAVIEGEFEVSGSAVKLVRNRLNRIEDAAGNKTPYTLEAVGTNKKGELVKHSKHTEFVEFIIQLKEVAAPKTLLEMLADIYKAECLGAMDEGEWLEVCREARDKAMGEG